MTFRILSLEGGGIRGVLSARLLKQVEEILVRETGERLHEYFNLIAGTSTGSILAAGIACQKTSDELIKLYEDEGENIFPKSIRKQRNFRWLSRLLGWHIGGNVLYPHKGLAQVLESQLKDPKLGRCPTLSEIETPNLLILAYDVYSRNTTWFANNPDSGYKQWYDDLQLWEVCTASASAPTFFPPYKLPFNRAHDEWLPHIDGGVSANSPELAALAHALLINKDKPGFSIKDISILSIGTGKTTKSFGYEEIKNWGLANWITNLPHIFLDPSTEVSVATSRQIMNSINDQRYLRLNFNLNERVEGKRRDGRLRKHCAPYNKYILASDNERKELSEAIDDPSLSRDLVKAADCYLHYGKTSYGSKRDVPVLDAIEQFIKANGEKVDAEHHENLAIPSRT